MDIQDEFNSWFSASEKKPPDAPGLEDPPFLEMAEVAAEEFAGGPKGAILQLPADDGRATSFLAPRVDWVMGIGEDRELLRLANERVKRNRLSKVTLQHGNVRHLPFSDGAFAGVYCQDLLSHLRAPEKSLKEMIRVCAPGGHIVADFLAPQDSTRHWPGMMPSGDGGFEYGPQKTYYRYYENLRLEEVLRQAGAAKYKCNKKEKSWKSDGNLGSEDVLGLRHGWLVVIRVDRA